MTYMLLSSFIHKNNYLLVDLNKKKNFKVVEH